MTTTTLAPVRVLGCPECADATSLTTIETLTGYAGCVAILTEGGVRIDPDGQTDVDWGSSTTAGISCSACGYSYEGPDWPTVLTG